MKTKILALFIAVFAITGCKKYADTYDTSDLYPAGGEKTATSSAVKVFYQNVAYYQLNVYRFEPTTSTWGRFIGSSFVTVPVDDSVSIGFVNLGVANSGTAMFDMPVLYSTEIGSTNVRTAKINAPKVLQFFPLTTGSKRGIVRVVKQDVIITRSNNTTFKIGISGEGSYDEETKVIDLVVKFDETDINGPGRSYQYKLSVNRLTL